MRKNDFHIRPLASINNSVPWFEYRAGYEVMWVKARVIEIELLTQETRHVIVLSRQDIACSS